MVNLGGIVVMLSGGMRKLDGFLITTVNQTRATRAEMNCALSTIFENGKITL